MAAANTGVIAMNLDKAIDQLKRDEGFRPLPYFDSRGVMTLGYGFNLFSDGLTQNEGSAVLHIRTWSRYIEMLNHLPWVRYIDDARQGVLLNMAYNLGTVGELKFHVTLADVQAKRYDLAAVDMLKSAWANQVGERAQRLAQQMKTGVWV